MSRSVVAANRGVGPNHDPGGGDGGLVSSPHDAEATADLMERVLTMRVDERKERWRSMFRHLQGNDIAISRHSFVGTLSEARPKPR